MIHRTRALLPALALLTAVLTALLAGLLAVVPAPAGAAAQTPPAPRVGSCHDLTAAESRASTDPDPATSCSRRHTGRTFLTPTLPEGTRMGDTAAVRRFVRSACGAEFERVTTRSDLQRPLSAYTYTYFRPTDQQLDDGARWLRCDLLLLAGEGLAPLPPRGVPALGTAPFPDSEARCQAGAPGDYRITVCTGPHAYRAKGSFSVRGDYPDYRERIALGKKHCSRIAGYRWLLSSPTKAQYDAGQRVFVCSRRTDS